VGRHCRPRTTLRSTLVVTATIAGLGAFGASSATAATTGTGSCTDRYSNPDVNVCHDEGNMGPLHGLVRLDPLVCAHVVIPDGRDRIVGTADCSGYRHYPVPVPCPPPPCPPCPVPAPSPAPNPVPAGGAVAPGAVTAAPIPVTVNGGPTVLH
jgi:hypothetical protein